MFNCRTQCLWNGERAKHTQITIAPAACERRALDGGAVLLGVTMKGEVVKRMRQQSERIVLQSISRWQLYAFGVLSDYQCTSEGSGLAGVVASAVTERSTEWC